MPLRRLLFAAALPALLTACDASPAVRSMPPSPAIPSISPSPAPTSSMAAGWAITVYYTVVEDYHGGAPTRVAGCPRLDCTRGHADLGTYPAEFVALVKTEGTGVTSDGRYLNWSYDTGFWLDTAPRGTDGNPLEPYVSAAADPDVLAHGTRFTVSDCGQQDDGSQPPPAVCAVFRRASWRIDDEFTPGLGGPRHIDVYVGRETGPGYTDSNAYVSLTNATLRF
ncbi:MAG TPA: hypothetical protein VH502_01440 [Actinoplanes sp.]|jgi:hypothetical protein